MKRAAERIQRFGKAIAEAIEKSAPPLRSVVAALQASRGIAMLTAVIIAELGILSRFLPAPFKWATAAWRPSEFSSGNRVQRGKITKTGNAPLRWVLVEASWAYQHRPWVGGYLGKRQKDLDPETIEIACPGDCKSMESSLGHSLLILAAAPEA